MFIKITHEIPTFLTSKILRLNHDKLVMDVPHFVLKPEWQKLVTYVPNKKLPVYNWFYYKEGFSRDIVMYFLKKWKVKNLLDPFCGVGTTLVACKEMGIDAFGFDVLPICILASRVKTYDYNINQLKDAVSMIKKSRFEMPDKTHVSKYVKRFFNPHILNDVLFFRDFLKKHFSGKIYDFLLLGLISSAIRCSYIYKDGAVLKVVKHPVPPFRKYYLRLLNRMINDLKKIRFKPCKIFVENVDTRFIPDDVKNNLEGNIEGVITSPPYLNKIEYSKIYKIEEMLFFSDTKTRPIRSFIGEDYKDVEPIFPDMDLPTEANAYLRDIKTVLENLYSLCKKNSHLAVIIGTAWFGDVKSPEKSIHVECDVLLSRIAELLGFETEKIYIVAERFFTINRTLKIGKARESIVVLKRV